jgi:hypothetical protein
VGAVRIIQAVHASLIGTLRMQEAHMFIVYDSSFSSNVFTPLGSEGPYNRFARPLTEHPGDYR